MKKEEIEHFYRTEHTCRGACYLRFFLMLFVCIQSFGFPEPTGVVRAVSGFAAPAFFILSGFFILSADEDRRKEKTVRKIKKSLIWFGVLFVVYALINAAVFLIRDFGLKMSRRAIFNFFVLDQWFLPVGKNLCFIHAMLYAYIVIFIAEKLKLMKFYKPVMIITFIITLLTSELAGLVHFNILGYTSLPACWLTSALPYILLGMFMREKRGSLVRLSTSFCILIFIAGGALAVGEILLLGRFGLLVSDEHFVGYGVMAFAVCCWAVTHPHVKLVSFIPRETAFTGLIYALTNPIYYVPGFLAGGILFSFVSAYGGLGALFFSTLISLGVLKTPLYKSIRKRHKEKAAAAAHHANKQARAQ